MKLGFVRENGICRIYRSDDGRLTVVIAPTDYGRDKGALARDRAFLRARFGDFSVSVLRALSFRRRYADAMSDRDFTSLEATVHIVAAPSAT